MTWIALGLVALWLLWPQYVLDGVQVSCVAPQWMFRFKTAYAPTAKDIADVSALAERFGFAIPDTHKPSALRSPA